jgi:hypothetical protein
MWTCPGVSEMRQSTESAMLNPGSFELASTQGMVLLAGGAAEKCVLVVARDEGTDHGYRRAREGFC